METMNAVITNARIEVERDMLTAWLELDYGGTSQGFGGYALYLPKSFKNHHIEGPAGHFIYRVMEIAGVESWSDLKGKTIRVKKTDGWSDVVAAIGHIVKNDWFCPTDDFKKGEE